MFKIKLVCIAGLVLLTTCTLKKEPGEFDWLMGKWMQTFGNGMLIEEWQKMDEGYYRGRSYAITGTDTTMLEQMELRQQDSTYLYAVELFKGKMDTFHLRILTDSSAVFIDTANDYPKQILYELLSENLLLIVLEGQKKDSPTKEEYRMMRVKKD